MDKKNMVDQLSQEARLTSKYGDKPGDPRWIKIWARDGFHCAYCGENLLQDVIRMTSAQLDHILPKSKYKDYMNEDANLVLSCYCCNQIKRAFDPLKELPEQLKMNLSPATFNTYKDELLSVCRNYIIPQLNKKKAILDKSNEIIGRFDKQFHP
jgi:hypothetical protein